jgi:hypothetical protein
MNAEPPTQQEIHRLKARIAEVYAQREGLKRALEQGAIAPRSGLLQLDATDRLLSDLDTRFKTLWDAARTSAQASPHPAAQWAQNTPLEPIHLDCITAIMLKILDGKCKMGAAESTALTAVYVVVQERPGQSLGDEVHALIAQARQGMDSATAASIHTWRVRAETRIPKPVMKSFKQLLRTSLPMPASDPREEPAP